jgi:hypothetical protein
MGLTGLAANGCGDPFVGTWVAVTNTPCEQNHFTVDDDLRGYGTLYSLLGACQPCDFTFQAQDEGGDKYLANVVFSQCSCPNGSRVASAVCDLVDDGVAYCYMTADCYSQSETFQQVSD